MFYINIRRMDRLELRAWLRDTIGKQFGNVCMKIYNNLEQMEGWIYEWINVYLFI